MAKKRAKKATRRVSKAKRPRARRRKRAPEDRADAQPWLFDGASGEVNPAALPSRPPRKLTPRQRAIREEREQASRIRVEEMRARRRARLAMRPPEMRSKDYALPQELQDWLLSLFSTAEIDRFFWEHKFGGDETDRQEVEAKCYELRQFALDWYLQGCRQGYIEGRTVELLSGGDRVIERTKKTRAKLVPFDGVEIPMDERDARIFFELPAMRQKACTADEGDELMGKRAGFADGRQVRNIFFEQAVLREWAALVQQGFGEARAAERVVQKYGIDKHGKPRHKKVRAILTKAPQRTLPEVH